MNSFACYIELVTSRPGNSEDVSVEKIIMSLLFPGNVVTIALVTAHLLDQKDWVESSSLIVSVSKSKLSSLALSNSNSEKRIIVRELLNYWISNNIINSRINGSKYVGDISIHM